MKLSLKLKPKLNEIAWVAATFVFFFMISLGVNLLRGKPVNVFYGKPVTVKNPRVAKTKVTSWVNCTLDEMESFMKSENIVIIDARPSLFYNYGHIPGAISLPVNKEEFSKEAGKKLSTVAKERKIVIYCADKQCENAEIIAGKIWDIGYINIYIYMGGWTDWSESGRAIEK